MKEDFGLKAYLSVLRVVILLSAIFILSTVFLGVSNLEKLSSFCICKINYLAYSWIAFAITILLSLLGFYLSAVNGINDKRLPVIEKINLALIVAGFICGLILLLVFAGLILNIL